MTVELQQDLSPFDSEFESEAVLHEARLRALFAMASIHPALQAFFGNIPQTGSTVVSLGGASDNGLTDRLVTKYPNITFIIQDTADALQESWLVVPPNVVLEERDPCDISPQPQRPGPYAFFTAHQQLIRGSTLKNLSAIFSALYTAATRAGETTLVVVHDSSQPPTSGNTVAQVVATAKSVGWIQNSAVQTSAVQMEAQPYLISFFANTGPPA
ncbi:hypothetical protein PsYK624_003760 [Phanerochaete sordida]|uniref:Uncharacterized protein n=1 Tax=Phanerochaete sordida TaxID=48140 RepID=A0A9P3FY03_9APHY|nr:hypothetical protein PsYK624_003760 [Phanerochaete sordida]